MVWKCPESFGLLIVRFAALLQVVSKILFGRVLRDARFALRQAQRKLAPQKRGPFDGLMTTPPKLHSLTTLSGVEGRRAQKKPVSKGRAMSFFVIFETATKTFKEVDKKINSANS